MPSIDYPSFPTAGQTATYSNGNVVIWDGSVWRSPSFLSSGTTGPQGLTGPQGISGSQGPTGTINYLITYRRLISSATLDSTDLSTVNSGSPLIIEMNVATANSLTVPLDSTVGFSLGTQITISQYGAGQTTIVAATSSITLRSTGNFLKLAAQYSMATLMKVGTNEWYVVGQLAP